MCWIQLSTRLQELCDLHKVPKERRRVTHVVLASQVTQQLNAITTALWLLYTYMCTLCANISALELGVFDKKGTNNVFKKYFMPVIK